MYHLLIILHYDFFPFSTVHGFEKNMDKNMTFKSKCKKEIVSNVANEVLVT